MIKRIEKEDIAECTKVIKDSFLTVAEEFGFTIDNAPAFTAFSMTAEKLELQLNDENRSMYAFYEDGCIVGYYSLLLQEAKQVELNNLCVAPSHRHKKIGENLLKHAFAVAKDFGCTKINIGIVEENELLRKWYEKFGFKHVGTQKFDFFPFTCGYMEKEDI